ncbi:MAG: hypothetical protein ACYTHJ_15170 [Planctomycetota bacterium]|jgi:hypothetical protein
MRIITFVEVLGLSILIAGCVRTIHPLYTKESVTFDPRLIGQWTDDDSDKSWQFSKHGESAYKLVYINDGKRGDFIVHLVRIGNELFLDFFPEEPELNNNEFYKFHIFPVHTFAHVQQVEPLLKMRFPDPKWLEAYLASHPDALRHEVVDDEVLLTASSKELQKFWLSHASTDEAFGDPSRLQRSAPKPSLGRSSFRSDRCVGPAILAQRIWPSQK